MAQLAMACGVSHAPGLTGWPEAVSDQANRTVREIYAAIGAAIDDVQLDLIVIVANDHVNNSRLRDYPDFLIGASPCHRGPDTWFQPWLRVPPYELPGSPDAAYRLGDALHAGAKSALDIRVTDQPLRFDDNVSVPVHLAGLQGRGIPLVPIMQNCTVPPIPDERACYGFGRDLGAALVEALPEGLRVGVMGSGGLSHEPGGPRYLQIDSEYDQAFMDLIATSDHERLLEEETLEVMEAVGSGGTAELLSWLVAAGAVGERPCRQLGYVAAEEWRCGVGGVMWEVP